MIRIRSAPALRVVLATVLALGVSACSRGSVETEETTRAPEVAPAKPPAPPPATAIRVVDGDTAKPLEQARIVVRGRNVWTGGDGVAALGVPQRRFRLRVSSPHYGAREVRVDFRQGLLETVPLWRPDLQWQMFGVNPARTQVHSQIGLRPPFRTVWTRQLHGLLEFPAMVWEGVAYVNTMRGVLRALSVESGKLLWRRRVAARMASSPAIDSQRRVLVTTSISPGNVSVVSLDTGRIRWRYRTGPVESSPVVRKGVAYFATTSGNVYALDLDRRRARWVFHGGAKITGSPALVGNRIYIGDYAGRVFALNVRTGRRIWTGSAGTRVYGTTAVAGGRVFVPSVFSGLSALSARSGRLLWRIPVGVYLYSSPAVFRGRVYFGTYASRVYSADVRTGRILWTRLAGGAVSGAVQVVAGVVYAASFGNRTTAWHWRSGRTLWTFPHGRYVPVSGNGARLLLHGPSQIWAVRPKRRR